MRFEQNIPMTNLPESAVLLVEDSEEDILLLRRAFRNADIANRLAEVRDVRRQSNTSPETANTRIAPAIPFRS